LANAVAQEVMRFGHLTMFIARKAIEDVVVGDIAVPKGTNIWMAPNQVCEWPAASACIASIAGFLLHFAAA
jgi:Cytochrome P450